MPNDQCLMTNAQCPMTTIERQQIAGYTVRGCLTADNNIGAKFIATGTSPYPHTPIPTSLNTNKKPPKPEATGVQGLAMTYFSTW